MFPCSWELINQAASAGALGGGGIFLVLLALGGRPSLTYLVIGFAIEIWSIVRLIQDIATFSYVWWQYTLFWVLAQVVACGVFVLFVLFLLGLDRLGRYIERKRRGSG